MINNEVIENELNDLEREMSDLLARIKQLRKEVSKITVKQKVIYEQYKTKVDGYINNKYTIKSRLIKPCKCLNYVSKNNRYLIENLFIYSHIDNDDSIPISSVTSLIIETYIPNENVVLVVELWQ